MSAEVTLGGTAFPLNASPLQPGDHAPNFRYTRKDMTDHDFYTMGGDLKVIVAVPSMDTPICQAETRRFNQEMESMEGVRALAISRDLPFAMERFCAAEGIENLEVGSDFRFREFADAYGVRIADGPFADLTARAVFVVDGNHKVLYTQLVSEVGHEPDYEAVKEAIQNAQGAAA
jgi:thiol peroxidase